MYRGMPACRGIQRRHAEDFEEQAWLVHWWHHKASTAHASGAYQRRAQHSGLRSSCCTPRCRSAASSGSARLQASEAVVLIHCSAGGSSAGCGLALPSAWRLPPLELLPLPLPPSWLLLLLLPPLKPGWARSSGARSHSSTCVNTACSRKTPHSSGGYSRVLQSPMSHPKGAASMHAVPPNAG